MCSEGDNIVNEKFTWKYPEIYIEKPLLREGCQGCIHNNNLYVFGGFDNAGGRSNRLAKYTINSQFWTHVEGLGDIPSPRYGHSVTLVNDNIWVYGGEGQSFGINCRDILGDIFVYRILEEKWERVVPGLENPTNGKAAFMPSPRRGHSATSLKLKDGSIGLYIFGGKGPDRVFGMDVFFNDVQRLDLTTLLWRELETTGSRPTGRTYHSTVMIPTTMYLCVFGGLYSPIHSTVKSPRLVKRDELRIPTTEAKIDDSIFADNKLHILDLQTLEWNQPHMSGFIPQPRYGHCMSFHEDIPNALFLYGGRTKSGIDNQLYILFIESSRWSQVSVENPPPARHNHIFLPVDQMFLVFGGYGTNGLCDADIYKLEIPCRKTSRSIPLEYPPVRKKMEFQRVSYTQVVESTTQALQDENKAVVLKKRQQWLIKCRSNITASMPSMIISRKETNPFNIYSTEFRPPSRSKESDFGDEKLVQKQQLKKNPTKVLYPFRPTTIDSLSREHASMFTGNRTAILRRKKS